MDGITIRANDLLMVGSGWWWILFFHGQDMGSADRSVKAKARI